MKRYLVLAILPFFMAACSKSGSNNSTTGTGITNGIVQTASGAYVIAGTLTTIGTNCGSTTATLTVTTYTGYGTAGTAVTSATVTVGQTFSMAVAAGTYYLSAIAGQCQITPTAVQALTNGQTGYSICLGQSCTSTGYSYGYPYYGYKASASTLSTGDISQNYPSTGELQLNPNIYLTVNKVTPFDLNISLSSGNAMITSVPSLTNGWNGSVAGDGSIKVGEASIDHLAYTAQVDASLLQYDSGFCDDSAAAETKAATYLKQAGFEDRSVQAFQTAWTSASLTGTVCIYPQDSTSIAKVSTYKTDSKINPNRVWFVVTTDSTVQTASGKKMSEKITKLISRPKTDALAMQKKVTVHRKIASDSDILADEWALGFVIQK